MLILMVMSSRKTAVPRVFVGGATGATGQATVRAGHAAGWEMVPQVRPKSAGKWTEEPEAALVELADETALDAALRGCDAVICAIGTMKKRFASGDTYETSDIGATRLLQAAAARCAVERFILVSASGADWILGAYYEAKREAERIAKLGPPSWTIIRPSALERQGDGGKLRWLGKAGLPGLRGLWDDSRPIPVEVVAEAMLEALRSNRGREEVLTGRDLWQLSAAWRGATG
jgi:uncharacterized protein YbjT (DUF2867 family)